jgi:hypothetical protein
MNWNPFEWLMKWILILIFGPPLLILLLQILVGYLAQLLPFLISQLLPPLILIAVIVGLAAGVGCALMSGRRSTPRRIGGSYGPPLRSPFNSREQNWR